MENEFKKNEFIEFNNFFYLEDTLKLSRLEEYLPELVRYCVINREKISEVLQLGFNVDLVALYLISKNDIMSKFIYNCIVFPERSEITFRFVNFISSLIEYCIYTDTDETNIDEIVQMIRKHIQETKKKIFNEKNKKK